MNALPEQQHLHKSFRWIGTGLLFALLWASASTATKIGLLSAQPLTVAVVRFAVAGSLMLAVSHAVNRHRLPQGKEWMQLTVYGLLNITIYLGLYVIAMQTVTAGIGALAVAANPIFISFLSLIFFKKPLTRTVVLAILICTAGVLCAAWPLFGDASVTPSGLLLLLFSMVSYSAAAIYFSSRKWKGLSHYTINGWQTLIGGFVLLPFAAATYDATANRFDGSFWGAVLWLAVPVSIVAAQLWLQLLQADAVHAGMWLFLCPLFGFAIAATLMNDTISGFTGAGVLLVMTGMWLVLGKTLNDSPASETIPVRNKNV